jgi:hypothetical protein
MHSGSKDAYSKPQHFTYPFPVAPSTPSHHVVRLLLLLQRRSAAATRKPLLTSWRLLLLLVLLLVLLLLARLASCCQLVRWRQRRRVHCLQTVHLLQHKRHVQLGRLQNKRVCGEDVALAIAC